MLSGWFKKSSEIPFREFITAIKNGDRNFFKILKIKESDFNDASFDELLSNTDDVTAGVNRVQKNFNHKFFTIFNNCLIKYHDNGDIKFVFFTVTNDAKRIIEFASVLFNELGTGNFDDRRFTPFTKQQKIIELAQGIYLQESDELVHLWFHENINFLLQYRISPLRQFSLMVTIAAPKEYDHSVRRKGTILDLLNIDIHYLLNTEPIAFNEEFAGDKIKFVDYTYPLDKQEFNAFDTMTIRIFDDIRSFRKNTQTSITLFSSQPIEPDKKIAVVESLFKIYGKDNSSYGELGFHERDMLEAGYFWTGRTWQFNQHHGLWVMENKNEKMSYEVRVDDMEDEEGFKVSVYCYNELVDLFGVS